MDALAYDQQLVKQLVSGKAFRRLLQLPLLAWQEVAIIVFCYTVVIGGAYAYLQDWLPYWLILPASGIAIYMVFTPLHDATHRSVSRSAWLNDVLGTLAAQPLLPGFSAAFYRFLHLEHHRFTGHPEKDPDELFVSAKLPWRWLAFTFVELHWLHWYSKNYQRRSRREFAKDMFCIACYLAWHAAWLLSPYAWEFFILLMLPQRVGIFITGYLFASIQHPEGVEQSEHLVAATRMFKGGRLMDWLMLYQSKHLMHHLFPMVPYYRYRHAWALAQPSLRPETITWDLPLGRPNSPSAEALARQLPLLAVEVTAVEALTAEVKAYTFKAVDNRPLPPFQPGAHIDVHIAEGLNRQYSLTGLAPDGCYSIAVKREEQGRGGSVALQEKLVVGQALSIGHPRNLFTLAPESDKVLLLAGGIGVTPLIAMAEALHEQGRDFELHIAARSQELLPFSAYLAGCDYSHKVKAYFGERWIDVADLPKYQSGYLLYNCGPASFMRHIETIAKQQGWPGSAYFKEAFSADDNQAQQRAFSVELARSGRTIEVAEGQSLLDALQDNSVVIEASCEQGFCGTCRCKVLSGEVEHRDTVFTEQQREAGWMTACVSRAAGAELSERRLQLDL